jgi:hypothetical protein
MATKTTATRLMMHIAGGKCEELGCYNEAIWKVYYGQKCYHWCPKHTVKYMSSQKFWQKIRKPEK